MGAAASSAKGMMVAGASAATANRYVDGDNGRISWLAQRLAAGDFNNPEGQRALRSQLPTQQGYDNQQLPRNYYYQQTFRHHNPRILSTTRNITTAELTLTDDYKEFIRAQIQNSIDRDTPFRSYRAEHWPERERRRVPFFNSPNSCFHTKITVAPDGMQYLAVPQMKKAMM